MATKLVEVGVEAFNVLDRVNQVEVATLFIITRTSFATIGQIEIALESAITVYNELLADINAAGDVAEMQDALDAIGALTDVPVDAQMAETVLEKMPTAGYASIAAIIEALTPEVIAD